MLVVNGERHWRYAASRAWCVPVAVAVVALAGCALPVGHPAKVAAPSPTTSVPPTTTTTAPLVTYLVRRGDTLTAIAKRYGVQIAAIASANHLLNLDVLKVGEVLRIPPLPPFVVTVNPLEGPAGTAFQLHLTGLQPTDTATFSIAAPGQHPYTGPPHTPAPDGSVTATYQTWPYDTAGVYLVLAHAANGKRAYTSFKVDKASPAVTSAP